MDEDLTTKQKVIYWVILLGVQLFQLTGVIIIAYINKAVYEFFGIYLGLIIGRLVFRKSWHSDVILICTVITFTVFYFLTKGVLPTYISVFCCFVFGFLLAYIFYILAVLKEKIDTKIEIHEEDGNIKLDLKDLTNEELRNLCIKRSFSEVDTNFLIDFIKNPKGLKKYEIAVKYNYDRSYIYKLAKRLIKILESGE